MNVQGADQEVSGRSAKVQGASQATLFERRCRTAAVLAFMGFLFWAPEPNIVGLFFGSSAHDPLRRWITFAAELTFGVLGELEVLWASDAAPDEGFHWAMTLVCAVIHSTVLKAIALGIDIARHG